MASILLSESATLDILLKAALITIIVPLLTSFINNSFSHFWGSIFNRKKEYLWNEIVLRNKTVKQSFDEYKNLGSGNAYWPFFLYIGSILGALTPIIIVSVCLNIAKRLIQIEFVKDIANLDQILSIIIPLSFFFVILFLIFVIIRINHYSKDFEKEDLIKKYNTVWNLNLATSNFIVLFFIFYLIYFSVVFKIGFNLEEYLFTSVGFFLLDGGTLVLLFCSVYLNMKVYKQNIKLYLNTKYGKNYPHVYVSTNGTNEATGQVSDIFNSKYLILNNEGTEEIILWSSIDLLKIQEYKQLKSNSQKSIFEY